MDNFKAIYRILSTLEKAMDLTEFDTTPIGYRALGVSKERWSRYIEMLLDAGYIKGRADIGGIQITLKGLEYLQKQQFN